MTDKSRMKWTDQQGRAIAARDRNVLVTASAGTGKTAVLSGRCVGLVSDAAVCPSVLNVLVLTFTEAAAEEMRSRVAAQLREALTGTRDFRLARQLVLLQGADISTIHAFCKRLITERFHKLSLDPTFRVVDGDEAMLLKVEVLAETVDWAWRQPHMVEGLGELLRRRDLRENEGFLTNLIRLNDFLEGLVQPQKWCDCAWEQAEAADPLTGKVGLAQRRLVEQSLIASLAQLDTARTLYEKESSDGGWADKLVADVMTPIAAALEQLQAGHWAGCVAIIRDFEKPRAPALRGFDDSFRELLKKLRDDAIKEFVGFRDLAVVNPAYMDVVGRSVGLQGRVLIEMLRRFAQLYEQRKRGLNGLDFADLERYALRLLTRPGAERDSLVPSETALALRSRYRHIFVDEYQDINPVQQEILDALSGGDNVFTVGDIKQSIYGWRGAEPTIFLRRLNASGDEVGDLRIDLNTNFRSVPGVLDFVNTVFGRIMTETSSDIDYDDRAYLRPSSDAAAQSASASTPPVELHILDDARAARSGGDGDDNGDSDTDSGAVDARRCQAMLIARRIRKLVGAEPGTTPMQIHDTETDRPRDVEYRDIVVLMRSLAKKANDYVEVFRLAGIPVSCSAMAGYFEATEISDVLCLLKVLDNPRRDIELAAVLRSPFFGFGETDLARLRIDRATGTNHDSLYTCAERCRDKGPDKALQNKLAAAFETLDGWRTVARRGHLADLLWRIYRDRGYLAFVCALPNGRARRANLLKLHDRAIQFEGFTSSGAVPSLTRFVEFIEKLQETGQDWTPAEPAAAAGNAVRILSVHKSKGLEFPVVFLAGLETQFNVRDTQGDLVVDAESAVGLKIFEPRSKTKLSSLAHQVIGERKRAAALAEEMRILYVATTRAKERLVITALKKRTRCDEILAKGLLLGGKTVPDWLVRRAQSPLEWLLYALAEHKVLHKAFATPVAEQASADGLFTFTLHGPAELAVLSQLVQSLRDRKAKRSSTVGASDRNGQGRQLLAELKERLDWRYPYAKAVTRRAKSSVTDLTHGDDEYVRRDYSAALQPRPVALAAEDGRTTRPGDAAAFGTAVHLLMAQIDLSEPVTPAIIEQTRDRLVASGALTPSLAGRIDVEAVAAFFDTEPGLAAIAAENQVWREWPFTFGKPVADQSQALDIMVVQGIIDLLVQMPDGLLVVDFKTDRIDAADVAARAESYREQLDWYAEAAGKILRQPVLSQWLYFFDPREAVRL